MGIREFIRDEVFAMLLGKRGVLVVYDPDRRYRDLCRSMGGERVTVVDASESSIESREAALAALPAAALNGPRQRGLLIYVPTRPPVTDEAKQADPFAAYGTFGATFPEGDGHAYLSLCLRAKPDHAAEIRRLFDQDPSPAFELIDNVGGGLKWPTLRTLLGVESTRDILFALLVPTPAQGEALKGNDAWVTEARALLDAALGLKLKTKGKTWSSVAEELWRYLLFSEFRFDLPVESPAALAGVPHAPDAARAMVEDLCDGLRGTAKLRPTYVERAEAIERELNLPALCAGVEDLGVRDTFPFEERSVLAGAVRALREDRLDAVRAIVRRNEGSVWSDKGESREQWDLLAAALALVEACDDADRQLGDHVGGLNPLIDFYVANLRRVDQLQREFEQAVGDHVAPDETMAAVVDQARRRYATLMGKVQPVFTSHLETSGWPPTGRLANADVFDRHVAPLLKESGRRVAFIVVDALRYELGVALVGQLGDGDAAEIVPACTQMPTVTPVGMASLLPGAAAGLSLARADGGIVPTLDGKPLPSVTQRMDVLRARYGDRFAEHVLKAYVKGKPAIPATVSLLVLRDTEIDSHLENSPDTTLSLLQQMLKRIRVAVRLVKDAGFNDVVVATDHGFFLNAQAEAGDVCGKPAGTWITLHDRSLLGEGAGDSANFAIPAERVGIRGDFRVFAGPRSMAPYRRGLLYFHGGASLQEAIVPVLTVRLKKETQPDVATATITLGYRRGARRITTRLPVIEIAVESTDMFSQAAEFEILLEAQDRKGNVVGEAKAGGAVNAATGTITLRPGQKEQVTLRMAMEFEGKFIVKALNPTTLATYTTLELETDYAV
ncbi:PglZ domain-containing protein [Roseomonas genomospecies 6]|uniref:PglZ domain-containing protein n=1 Tax=Roseomonas genomospecies 6 TaxID=214106 RepID=A0A9W7NFS8_9PROT|nr:PglZ domain-containing protein [Roseomonas genomospecies 6]KAA0676970.1 PglZ domain-containing protein [Roseomonas genomospecies 6]